MDLSKYASKKFIKPEDLKDGPQRKTITNVEEGRYEKLVLTFQDRTRLALNATTTSTLIALFGSSNDQDWIAQRIELYAGTLKYDGISNPAVLVRALTPPKPQPPRDTMDDEVPF